MTNESILDRVTVVVVTFNSSGVISDVFKKLKNFKNIVVVDNCSADNTLSLISSIRSDICIIKNKKNLGFGAASNIGFEVAVTEYVLQISPDVMFEDKGVLALIDTLDSNRSAALVAPMLLNSKGGFELSVMGPRELNFYNLQHEPAGPFCTWFVIGAFWLWRRSVFSELQGYDSEIFLYSEDADICMRASKRGYALIVVPEVRVMHLSGQSCGKMSMRGRWRRDWNMAWSWLYVEAKHGDRDKAIIMGRKALIKSLLQLCKGILQLRIKKIIGSSARCAGLWCFLRS